MSDQYIEELRRLHPRLDRQIQTREKFTERLKDNLDAAQTRLDEREKERLFHAASGTGIYPQFEPEEICRVHREVHRDIFPDLAGKFRSADAETELKELFAELNELVHDSEESKEKHRHAAVKFLIRFNEIKPFEIGNEHIGLLIAHHFLEVTHRAEEVTYYKKAEIAWPSENLQAEVLPRLIENAQKGDVGPLIAQINQTVSYGMERIRKEKSPEKSQELRAPQSPHAVQDRDYTQGYSM